MHQCELFENSIANRFSAHNVAEIVAALRSEFAVVETCHCFEEGYNAALLDSILADSRYKDDVLNSDWRGKLKGLFSMRSNSLYFVLGDSESHRVRCFVRDGNSTMQPQIPIAPIVVFGDDTLTTNDFEAFVSRIEFTTGYTRQ